MIIIRHINILQLILFNISLLLIASNSFQRHEVVSVSFLHTNHFMVSV